MLAHLWLGLSAVTDCGGRRGFGSLPAWAEERWPGIISGNFTQHGVNFDISSPGVPILMKAGIKEFFAKIGCHPALGGFILGNEVRRPDRSPASVIACNHSRLVSAASQRALLSR